MTDSDIVDKGKKHISLFKELICTGNFNSAIQVELDYYNSFVKKNESLSAWKYWDQEVYEIKNYLSQYQTYFQIIDKNNYSSNGPIIFVYHNYSALAHETQLARKIIGMTTRGYKIPFVIVYLFGSSNEHPQAKKIWGCSHTQLFTLGAKNYTDAFLKLSRLVRNLKPRLLLYPSIYFLAFWSSIFTKHPNQKFFVMKYFPSQLGNISEWGSGIMSKHQHNLETKGKFTELPVEMFPSTGSQKIIKNKIRIGSISRVEKQLDPNYLIFIKKILDNYDQVEFLSTCKIEQLSLFPEWFTKHPRIKHLGWVNPYQTIHDFDIYLETFPWGGGDMSFLAISHGIPYLSLETKETEEIGPFNTIRAITTDYPELQEQLPANQDALFNQITLLIKSDDHRQHIGNLWMQAAKDWNSKGDQDWAKFLEL